MEATAHLETDLRGLLLILWRRRFVVLGTLTVGVALAALGLMVMQPQYTAKTLVLVNTNARQVMPGNLDINTAARYDSSLILNEVEIIRSRGMAKGVIERLGLARDPEFAGNTEGIFLKRLGVRPVPGSYAIQLEFTSASAGKAADIANAIADSYVEQSLEQSFAQSQKLSEWLDKRLSSLRAEVRAREVAIERYKAANNLREGTTTLLSAEQVNVLNKQLAEVKAAQADATARLEQVESFMNDPAQMESAGAVLQSEMIQKMKLDQARLEAKLAELSSRYGPKHPEILKLQSEIAGTEDSIRAEIATIARGIEAERNLTAARVLSLEESLRDTGEEKFRDDARMVGLRALEMEAESTRHILNSFLETYKKGERQEELHEPSAKIISRAVAPRAPAWPNTMLVLSLSVVMSLFAGLGLALILEKLDNSFRSAGQLETSLGIPCFALIPNAGKIRAPYLAKYALMKPSSPLAEAVRTLRMVMNLRSTGERPKVVTLTSSFPAEGKTTLSLWLARLAAQSGEKVVIVDCDLRRPNIHRASGQRGPADLADYLAGKKELNEIVCKDSDSPAHIIFGRSMPDALDLLGTARMRELIAALREKYDLVILDSPSCLAVPDVRLLATYSDCVLYAVRWDKTPREAVVTGVKQFSDMGYGALALVLTNVDVKKHAMYGYGDSAAYYGYAKAA